MAQLLTDREGVLDYLLLAYVEACETQNEGITERTISAVSGEINELLSERFVLPFITVPSVLRNIASVFVAYRIVQAITSLVSTEASSDNEWLPLQKQWINCNKLLTDIINGDITLGALEQDHYLDREEPSFQTISAKPIFDLKRF